VVALATSGTVRSSVMSVEPTIAEAGVPAYQLSIWLSVKAPAKRLQAVVDTLNAEILKVRCARTSRRLGPSRAPTFAGLAPKE
jgi:tripartite-type tricarboxylate transporter receptor subunit TctC